MTNAHKRLLLAFFIPAVFLFFGIYLTQTELNKEVANKEITTIIQYLENQCSRYDNIITSDQVRLQVDLIEKATALSRNIQYNNGVFSQEELEAYIKDQRMDGVIILDENQTIIQQINLGNVVSDFWQEILSSKRIGEILQYQNKVITEQISAGQITYTYVAVARLDEKGIIFCYRNTPLTVAGNKNNSMTNLLEGYTIDRSGTVALTNGETVISSNDESIQGKAVADCPRISMFNATWEPDKLVHVKKDGNWFYGRHVKCNQYYIYVFFPEYEIFTHRQTFLFYSAMFYLGLWAVILFIRQHLQKKQLEELEKQEREYQKEILKSAEDAKHANAAKTEFLRRMSHDIRTPINGIMGMLEIAEHYPEDFEKQKECRKKIKEASKFLFDLVNDVLDMNKMESGEIEIEESPFDLKEQLQKMTNLIEVQATEQGLTFSTETLSGTHWNVIGSPVHLHQILINIAGNAVKYNKKNGSIKLGTKELSNDGKTVWFQFICADTGKGMSEEFQEHMFEPFAQEHSGARTTFGGTGLGLAIVKKLVDKMNGTIEVESEIGKGSTFIITLPFKIDKEAKSSENTASKDTLSLQGMKILLVEDNELNMEIAEFILKTNEIEICKAWNGQEAVTVFEHSDLWEFDMILMDIMMPVMDGIEATKQIRRLKREDAGEIPIIAMTANAFLDDVKRNKEAGMNDQISKPIEVEKLIEVISRNKKSMV